MASVVQVQDRGRRKRDGREIWFASWGVATLPTAWQGWVASLVTLVAMAIGLLLAGEFGPRGSEFPYAVIAAIAPPNIWFWWFSRRHSAPLHNLAVVEIRLAELPHVLEAVARATTSPVFAAFIFNAPNRPKMDDALNLQFSKENGRAGFDWVLLGSANVRDADRFIAFASSRGHYPEKTKQNGVSQLRVENGDLARLCREVVTDMYGCPPQQVLDMVICGFEWVEKP